jgi:hypothetical protein
MSMYLVRQLLFTEVLFLTERSLNTGQLAVVGGGLSSAAQTPRRFYKKNTRVRMLLNAGQFGDESDGFYRYSHVLLYPLQSIILAFKICSVTQRTSKYPPNIKIIRYMEPKNSWLAFNEAIIRLHKIL